MACEALTLKLTLSGLGIAIPARKLLIFPVAGQAANEMVISTKKARTCFYISIIINEEKKILRTYFRIPEGYLPRA